MTTSDLLRLLTWCSPSFPTGGFAYSHGLEWAAEGDVRDEAGALAWIGDVLSNGSGRADAILLRHAYRAEGPGALAAVGDFAAASQPSMERRDETRAQGAAFAIAAAVWEVAVEPAPYPVAVGALARATGVEEEAVTLAYLHAFAANLVSAAVRLVPLGQTAGLRILRALEGMIARVAEETRGAALEDIGSVCFRADIASMRHETQHTRLFRS